MTNTRTLTRDSRKWTARAACGFHQRLPWTGDPAPTLPERKAMGEVCADCPVLIDCAGYALNKEVVGGFYAGVWLPWPTGRRNEAQERWRARRALVSERRALASGRS